MNKFAHLFSPPNGELRTVQAIRAKATLDRRVVSAIGRGLTMSEILTTPKLRGISPGYVMAVARDYGMAIKRPS